MRNQCPSFSSHPGACFVSAYALATYYAPAASIFAPTFTSVGSTGIGSRTATGNGTKNSAFALSLPMLCCYLPSRCFLCWWFRINLNWCFSLLSWYGIGGKQLLHAGTGSSIEFVTYSFATRSAASSIYASIASTE